MLVSQIAVSGGDYKGRPSTSRAQTRAQGGEILRVSMPESVMHSMSASSEHGEVPVFHLVHLAGGDTVQTHAVVRIHAALAGFLHACFD